MDTKNATTAMEAAKAQTGLLKSTLWGVKAPEDSTTCVGLLALVAHSEVEALKRAAEIVYGSQSQLSIGKLIVAGYRAIEVELKARDDAK